MTLPPKDCTHGQQRRAWHAIIAFGLADAVGRRRAWHAIIALGRQTWSNDVGRGMPSLPLGSTGGRTASGVACHHLLWPAHTVKRRRAWHAIIAFGKHTGSNDVTLHATITFGQHTQSNDVGRGMPSSPLGSTHCQTMSGVACHHLLWEAHTVEQRRAWHEITALRLHTPSDDIGRGMTSPPLYCMHGRKTPCVA